MSQKLVDMESNVAAQRRVNFALSRAYEGEEGERMPQVMVFLPHPAALKGQKSCVSLTSYQYLKTLLL